MREYWNADSFHSREEGKMTIGKGKKDRIEAKAFARKILKECRFQYPSIGIDSLKIMAMTS